jgi:hypothetical protein
MAPSESEMKSIRQPRDCPGKHRPQSPADALAFGEIEDSTFRRYSDFVGRFVDYGSLATTYQPLSVDATPVRNGWMVVSTACIAKLCKSAMLIHGAAASGAPLDHIKDVCDAVATGGEQLKQLRGPEALKLRGALSRSTTKLEKVYERALKQAHSTQYSETVQVAFSNLEEIFDRCLPDGRQMARLHYDANAVGNWIADRAVEHGMDVFREGEGRKLLVSLMTSAYASLDNDASFMATLARTNWGEMFLSIERIEKQLAALGTQSQEVRNLGILARDAQTRIARWQDRSKRWEFKQPGSLWSSAISPDGNIVVATSDNGTCTIWQAHRQYGFVHAKEIWKEDNEAIFADFSPDGALLAVCWKDGTVECLHASDPFEQVVSFNHGAFPASVRFAPDGNRLATSARNGTVKIWDLNARSLKREIQASKPWAGIYYVDFSPVGEDRCVTANGDTGEIALWSCSSGQKIASNSSHESGASSASFSCDGTRILTVGTSDQRALILDAETLDVRSIVSTKEAHSEVIWMATFSHDDRWFVTASEDKTAAIWNENGDMLAVLRHPRSLMTAVFDQNDKRVLTCCYNGCAYLWDLPQALVDK